MNKIAIKTTDLCKEFSDKIAVDKISLEIYEGEIFGILGPNGAGKTTFLKMLSTTLSISSGHGEIFGYDLKKEGSAVRSLIGLTGQYASIDKELTAMENLVIFGKLNGLKKSEAKSRAEELLHQFSLYDVRNKSVKKFSGGMHRRIDLAVGLIIKPKIVFLDEPTTGLDPRTRGEMWNVIRDIAKSGSTIVLTTQYLEEADQLSDRIAIIDNGKLVSLGTSNELKNKLSTTQLEISLLKCEQLEECKNIIRSITDEEIISLPEQNNISIKINNTNLMLEILTKLSDKNIEIEEFSVRKPTLDEVFLQFTGNKGEDNANI